MQEMQPLMYFRLVIVIDKPPAMTLGSLGARLKGYDIIATELRSVTIAS